MPEGSLDTTWAEIDQHEQELGREIARREWRYEFAGKILASWVSGPIWPPLEDPENLPRRAVRLADELLFELSKGDI